jgi:muramidase (phage lysozyme)
MTMTYPFDPTPEESSILGRIRDAQSGGRYNILFGGTRFEGFAAFPKWPGRFSYRGRETHAAGAYQFEPATWAEIVAAIGLPDFSPASQDIGALWLLRHHSQESQWGSNFTADGFVYAFAARIGEQEEAASHRS